LVVTSTVAASIFRCAATLGRRGRTCAAWRWSKCGAWLFSTFSKFQITASASKALPSWKVTPWRNRNTQRRRSAGSASQLVARPGTSRPGRSATSISQATSGS
jgi:hypothetical protein